MSKSAFDAAQSTLTNTREALRQGERQLASATIGATPEDLKRLKRTGSVEGMTLAAVQNARETIANRRFTVAQLAAQRDAAKVQVETLNASHAAGAGRRNREKGALRSRRNGDGGGSRGVA